MNSHPAAELFPMMSASEYAGLLGDIRANGLLEPILVDKKTNTIIDGRNRYRACRELGIKPAFDWWSGDDPTGYVVSKNLHRRHLNESQRAMIAARLANAPEGRPSETSSIDLVSQPRAAQLLNVSTPSVKRARVVLERGTPEQVQAVEAGTLAGAAAVQQIAVKEHGDNIRAMAANSRKEMQQIADQMTPEERLHWSNEYLEERGALARLLRDILKLGDPAQFARKHAGHILRETMDNAPLVRDWLAGFIEETETNDGHQRDCA